MMRAVRPRVTTGRTVLFALLALVGCGTAGLAQEIFERVEVAEGIYATVVRDGISPSAFANTLIVLRDDHVLVVDARHTPEAGEALVEEIGKLTDLPIRYLVTTHWHTDHVLGNQALRAASPQLQVIGGVTVAADLETRGRARVDGEIERYTAAIAERRGWLERGERDDGTELSDDEQDDLRARIEGAEAYVEQLRSVELIPPDQVVDSELILDDASPAIHVLAVGPAHTRGDVAVWIPERGVLAIGDLIEDGFPYFGDGYPAGWLASLDRLAELDPRILVPAHGPVLRDRALFDGERAFLRDLVEAADEAAERGRPMDPVELLQRLSGHRGLFTDDDPSRAGAYASFLVDAFGRAYAEASGDLEPAGGEPDA